MPVLATVRERKTGRIAKPGGRAVDDLGNQGQRLKRSRPELFQEQRRSEIGQVPLISREQHSPEPLEVDAVAAHFVPLIHDELADLLEILLRLLPHDFENGSLGRHGAPVHEIHDLPLWLAGDTAVRVLNETRQAGRMPVVTSSHACLAVHSLLHDDPVPFPRDDKRMQVELKAIANRVVVHASRQSAGADKSVRVESGSLADRDKFSRRLARMATATTADKDAQLGGFRPKRPFERADDRGGDARGMPIHSEHAAESLEPKGIGQAGQVFVDAVIENDAFRDRATECRHSLSEPRRHAAGVQRQIGVS